MSKEQTFRKRAGKGFAWNYLYKLTEFGLLNLYTILIVRHFGPQVSVPYAVFTALCTTISMFGAFAVDGVLLRYIHRISGNKDLGYNDFTNIDNIGLRGFLKTLFAFRLFVVTILSLLIFIFLFILPLFLPSLDSMLGSVREFSPYLIVFLYAQAIAAFCTVSLIGLLETKNVFIASLVSRGVLLAAGLSLVIHDSLSIHYAVGLYAISAVLNALYLLLVFSREVNGRSREVSSTKIHFSSVMNEIRRIISRPRNIKFFLATPLMLYGITTWGSDILSTVLGKQPDILMMRAMLGENSPEIGYYLSASILLLVTEYIFLFGLGGTLVSIFSKLAHDDQNENGLKQYPKLALARKEIAGFQNIMLLPLCAYMMVFAPVVMRSVYGSKYEAAIPMIRIGLLCLTLSVGIFGGGMQVTSLVAIGKERLVFRNRLFWGITNILANFFLIRLYGGMGAIIGTQFANAFACGTESYFAKKIIARSFDFFGTIRIIIISAISVTIVYYIIQSLGGGFGNIFNAVLSAFTTAVVITSLYALLGVPEAKKVWKRVRELFEQTNSSTVVNE
jgi:O-antigen/teichoic acid export membrane protein